MYRLAVQRDFVAQHFLIGGDWDRKTSGIPITTGWSSSWRARN